MPEMRLRQRGRVVDQCQRGRGEGPADDAPRVIANARSPPHGHFTGGSEHRGILEISRDGPESPGPAPVGCLAGAVIVPARQEFPWVHGHGRLHARVGHASVLTIDLSSLVRLNSSSVPQGFVVLPISHARHSLEPLSFMLFSV